jgi:hypothetical protein
MAGYIRTDKNRNTDIRQNFKIFIPGQKISEHQQNCFGHIPRMPAYRIPRKILSYNPKVRIDRDLPLMTWIDHFA